MTTQSPPKPWERASSTSTSTPTTPPSATAPPLPPRPSSLTTSINRTASNYALAGGAGPMGYNSFSRFGGSGMYGNAYSSGMYGGGGYNGGMYGGGGYNGGMYGGGGYNAGYGYNDPNSLTNTFSQSTQATFQIIENLVGAVGGVAQMLESTYMATHSSFFAMISVAEQFSNLKTTLGSILGIFALMRYLRLLFAKITGRPAPVDTNALTPSAFDSFRNGTTSPKLLPNGQPVPSKKPFLIFLAAVVGLPYLMSKLIHRLSQHHQSQKGQYDDSQTTPIQHLEFYHLLYDYPPPSSSPSLLPVQTDITVKKGDLVALLSKQDPQGNPSTEWWQCRTRNHQIGYLPAIYLQKVVRHHTAQEHQRQIDDGGRVNTISSSMGEEADLRTLSDVGIQTRKKPVGGGGGGGDKEMAIERVKASLWRD